MIEAMPAAKDRERTYPALGQKLKSLLAYTGSNPAPYSVGP